jgi:hypothetical protein
MESERRTSGRRPWRMPVEVPRSAIASIPDALAIDRNFRQTVEPREFLFQLARLLVMISRQGEDLLTSNPATVFETPGWVPHAEVPQKIKNVIRLPRGIQEFKNCPIHFFDGRTRPTAIADDVGMMEISSEPCIWHKLRSKRRVAVAALSISNGHVENLDTPESEPTRLRERTGTKRLHFSHPYVLSGRTNSSIASMGRKSPVGTVRPCGDR